MSKAVDNRMCDDALLDTFVEDFVSFVESIPKVVRQRNGFHEIATALRDKPMHNANIRLLVGRAVRSLEKCSGVASNCF